MASSSRVVSGSSSEAVVVIASSSRAVSWRLSRKSAPSSRFSSLKLSFCTSRSTRTFQRCRLVSRDTTVAERPFRSGRLIKPITVTMSPTTISDMRSAIAIGGRR